ncbi:MAG TPA: hypothetical protein VJS37_01145 [Terriglobales bacterium]|nr:hypothetical protein [Terriglobales bacterium]
MPKIIQMPKRHQSADPVVALKRATITSKDVEESASVAKLQRWLDLADAVLEGKISKEGKRPA